MLHTVLQNVEQHRLKKENTLHGVSDLPKVANLLDPQDQEDNSVHGFQELCAHIRNMRTH